MFQKKSHVAVAVLMVLAALFGCQCGAGPNKGNVPVAPPADQGNPANQGIQADPVATLDPTEKPALDVINKFGGAKVEGGHVVDINMYKPGVSEADVKLLATLPKVQAIQMNSTGISGVGLKDLAGLQHLTKLDIGQNPLTDAGLKEAFTLKQLKYLRFTKAKEDQLPGLAGLTQLEELMVDGCGFTSSTAAINIAKALPRLKRLWIGNNNIGDFGQNQKGVTAIVSGMPDLEELHMIGCQTSDKDLALLPKLKKLEKLSVGPMADDAGMKSLAGCTSLRELRIFNTHATDKCLADLGRLPNLKVLTINNGVFGKISDAGVAEFGKAHPNCQAKLEKW